VSGRAGVEGPPLSPRLKHRWFLWINFRPHWWQRGRRSARPGGAAGELAVISDLRFLAGHDCLAGVEAVISARASWLRHGWADNYAAGTLVPEAAREIRGPHPDPQAYATAAAMLAAEIDRLRRNGGAA
jgi:hypothetical protein